MAKRIQRKRTKGWRMPDNAIYVGRPTEWGNPFSVGDRATLPGYPVAVCFSQAEAVDAYRAVVEMMPAFKDRVRSELRGKDLACWCPLDQPCHADVLLELANAVEEGE